MSAAIKVYRYSFSRVMGCYNKEPKAGRIYPECIEGYFDCEISVSAKKTIPALRMYYLGRVMHLKSNEEEMFNILSSIEITPSEN